LRNLFPFHLGNVIKKLNKVRIAFHLKHQNPFPKSPERLLSHYCFVPRRIKINPSGQIARGLSRFVTSLIDFSFVRSIAASAYSRKGGHAYDRKDGLSPPVESSTDLKSLISSSTLSRGNEVVMGLYRLIAYISSPTRRYEP